VIEADRRLLIRGRLACLRVDTRSAALKALAAYASAVEAQMLAEVQPHDGSGAKAAEIQELINKHGAEVAGLQLMNESVFGKRKP